VIHTLLLYNNIYENQRYKYSCVPVSEDIRNKYTILSEIVFIYPELERSKTILYDYIILHRNQKYLVDIHALMCLLSS